MAEFRRAQTDTLAARLAEPRRFLQAVVGPRQVGKTTLVDQVLATSSIPFHHASGDEPTLRGGAWLEQQWEAARLLAKDRAAVLVIDEVQKAPHWSETVKRLWDEDTRARRKLKVVLLGSAPLLIQDGLTESLNGRFELLHLRQWSFAEMRAAFGWSLDRYIFHGGYPGAATLIDDHDRWQRYIRDALVETTIARDVLLLTRIDKPALLRRLFELACRYSSRELSYTKMLGQLQDPSNTVTLAHYLHLLDAAGMVAGLSKFSGDVARQRGSSPKLLVHDTGLMTALDGIPYEEARREPETWGRIVESAVGAHLLRAAAIGACELFWWRDGDREVDFVVRHRRRVVAIEVKSGRRRGSLPGMAAFAERFPGARKLLVGADGIPVASFLEQPVVHWLSEA
ncbi:MAG: ATP-binding protein [Planctomycetota bacterium]